MIPYYMVQIPWVVVLGLALLSLAVAALIGRAAGLDASARRLVVGVLIALAFTSGVTYARTPDVKPAQVVYVDCTNVSWWVWWMNGCASL